MKRLEPYFGRLLAACGAISAALILVVTLVITVNVILRNVFGARVPGDIDLSEYAMLLITAFTAPWLLKKGQHVRIDLMLHRLPASLGWLCEIFADVLGLGVSLLLTWYGVRVLFLSIASGNKVIKEFIIPEWLTLWPLPLMFFLLAVEFVFRLQRVASGPRRPRHEGAPI